MTYKLPWWHPPIQQIADERIPGPSNHPLLDSDEEFQAFIRKYTREGHRFFDSRNGRRGYIERPWRLPRDHPDCDRYFEPEDIPRNEFPTSFFAHPNIMDAYLDGDSPPADHPSVSGMLQNLLPRGHPDVDDLLQDPEDLPDWHPDLDLLINRRLDVSSAVVSLYSGHPNLKTEYDAREPVDDHPSVHFLFERYIPPSHPNIDDLMHEGFTLPDWHPHISSLVEERSLISSPASLLTYFAVLVLVSILVLRFSRKLVTFNKTKQVVNGNTASESNSNNTEIAKQTMDETTMTAKSNNTDSEHSDYDNTVMQLNEGSDSSFEVELVTDDMNLPRLDQRHHAAMELHRYHVDHTLSPSEESFQEKSTIYKEKKSSTARSLWKSLCCIRIPKSSWTIGDGTICLSIVGVNVAALVMSPTYGLNLGFGSLSVGNTMFLVILATKNSIFTWMLGMAFDHLLLFHRFLGKLTILTALIHSLFYVKYMFTDITNPIILSGVVALGCGLLISLTSLNWVRRNYFNVFFFSHFAFIGFLVGIYIHANGARPYIILSVASYGVDKVLQFVWIRMPSQTIKFEKLGDRTAHVTFAKSPLSKMLGRHKVGQYVFVNFPELSKKEWHPFSVASSPNDPNMDLYIRALGNHTKKIVDFAEKCEAENKQTMIRCDGPYGNLSFNYRRYGVLVLAGGGIGITPLLGILRDIYETPDGENKEKKPLHCIKSVHLVWVMTQSSEASLFLGMLNEFFKKSAVDPLLPDLKMSIHITRDTTEISGLPVQFSRPDFVSIMNDCAENMPGDSRSVLVYACGPVKMIKNAWDASMYRNSKRLRVDFYHESFEF